MTCSVESKEIEEIRTSNILPQTPFWARVKNEHGFLPSGFQLTVSKDLLQPDCRESKKVQDDLLILIRYLDKRQCYAYVPYGPKIEPDFENQGVFLEELSEVIRPHLPGHCIFIRYDLLWKNQWAEEQDFYDSSGNWAGPPPELTQEFRLNYNTHQWKLQKSPGDILPKNTFFLDLKKKESDLLGSMRFNTRYNIRRALRRGVTVKEAGMEGIDAWYNLYRETALRHDMTIQDKDYFATLLTNQDNSPNHGVTVKLMMAGHEGQQLASLFLVMSEKRGTYLYGASTLKKKHLMASYALQWEAIREARRSGCEEYDMFGCAPNLDKSHPLYGVHLFKKGFGGRIYHRMGCWDYPFQMEEYSIFRAREMNNLAALS